MFKEGEIVIYPHCGMSKISRIYSEEINGSMVEYYEVVFDGNLTVSIPKSKALSLGLRSPLSKKQMLSELAKLREDYTPDEEVLGNMQQTKKNLMESGLFGDAIQLVKLIKWIAKEKSERSKKLEFEEREILNAATSFISSEISFVLGESVLAKYEII